MNTTQEMKADSIDVRGPLQRFVNEELLSGGTGASVGGDDSLVGDGLVDSLGMMRLVMFIEERFDTNVPPEDVTLENFLTLNAIGEYLVRRGVS